MFTSKKYYFLAGLPRSGNTLLASILNQNKNISVTPNSYVSEMIFRIENIKNEMVGVYNFPDTKSFENVSKNILKNYYSNWKSNYIIDRSCWGTPNNLEKLKQYCPNEIKILVLTRNIEEILASFIKWSQENPGNFLEYYSSVEEKCEFLMNPNGQIAKQLYSYQHLMRPENKKYALFISYNDLVMNTEETIFKIYEFLKIRKYNHHYKNLSQLKVNNIEYCDEVYGKNLHRVKETVEKSSYLPTDYIPQSVLNKYSNYNISY